MGDKTTIMNKNVYIVYGGQLNSSGVLYKEMGWVLKHINVLILYFAPFLIVHYKLELQFKNVYIDRRV